MVPVFLDMVIFDTTRKKNRQRVNKLIDVFLLLSKTAENRWHIRIKASSTVRVWGFPARHGGSPKWLVYFMENPNPKWMMTGGSPIQKHHMEIIPAVHWLSSPISAPIAACLQGYEEVIRDRFVWFGRWWMNLHKRSCCSTWIPPKINMEFPKIRERYLFIREEWPFADKRI